MNPFGDYDKSDISNVVMNQDYFRAYDDNEEPMSEPCLLDMDTINARSKNDHELIMSRSYERYDYSDVPIQKKCPLGEDMGPDQVGRDEWRSKMVEEWCADDTCNWLYTRIVKMDLPTQVFQTHVHNLVLSGKELLGLSRHEFVTREPRYGDELYNMLHTQMVGNRGPNGYSLHQHHPKHRPETTTDFQRICHEDEPTAIGSNNGSDAESDNSVEISTKRPPGRPRLLKTKKNPTSQGKLWEFIRDLLRNRKTCPSLICWEDYSQAKFRFVRSDEVAKLWGSRKGNTKMTYEKLSRAMRYYYKRKIFLPVLGRRLVYQFGPNATGWQTDNPNFRF